MKSGFVARLALFAGIVFLLLPLASPGESFPWNSNQNSTTRAGNGYQARPCGFDLDDDGKVGERKDDCNLCDGRTTDPDGDGIAEDLIYVDAGIPGKTKGGSDSTGDGSANKPYKTLAFALQKADGPEDGAEDIICLKGIAREGSLAPTLSGPAGHRVKKKSGSQARDFEYPTQPAAIVGWDADDDGQYPPYDTDDVSVLDGSGDKRYRGEQFAFTLGKRNSRFELAHLTIRDYGRYYHPRKINPKHNERDASRGGFVRFGDGGGRASHIYMHDLSIENINKDTFGSGHRILFYFFTRATVFHYLAFENLNIPDTSSFMVRGSGPSRPSAKGTRDFGPLRWQNLTVTLHGADERCTGKKCVSGFFSGWKLWGYITGIEILDSRFDANMSAWKPRTAGGNAGTLFVHPTQCTQQWTIRNNDLRDFRGGLNITGGNGKFCGYDSRKKHTPRPVDEVLFEGNVLVNTYPKWKGIIGAKVRGGDDPRRTTLNVTIKDNIFASTAPVHACVLTVNGNLKGKNPGTTRIENNLCRAPMADDALAAITIGSPRNDKFMQEKIIVKNNVITGLQKGYTNLRRWFRPRGYKESANVFDRSGTLREKKYGPLNAGPRSRFCLVKFKHPDRLYERAHSLEGCSNKPAIAESQPNSGTKPPPAGPPTPTAPPETNPVVQRPPLPRAHPGRIKGAAFYIDSTFFERAENNQRSVTRCNSELCYKKTAADRAYKIANHYCDTAVFGDGCIRRWEDQIAYRPRRKFKPPEWIYGRDFGQDDLEKPGFIRNCLNGKPCARGGHAGQSKRWKQNLSLEIENGQTVALPGPFSIFLLARPVAQQANYFFFGSGSGQGLYFDVKSKALHFKIAYPPRRLSAPGAIQPGRWYLLGVTRDPQGKFSLFINGRDKTAPGVRPTKQPMNVTNILSQIKGKRPFHGDLSAFAVYTRALNAKERERLASYWNDIYRFRQ